MWFKRMNFDKVTHASLNETLEINYHKVVQIMKDKVKNRNPKQLLGLHWLIGPWLGHATLCTSVQK